VELYRYMYLVRAVQNYLHPFDHHLPQPSLCIGRLVYDAFHDYLVVAHEDRHGSRTLSSTLPQEGV
jgi:hypothetical protein